VGWMTRRAEANARGVDGRSDPCGAGGTHRVRPAGAVGPPSRGDETEPENSEATPGSLLRLRMPAA